jgi:hypothetical protein
MAESKATESGKARMATLTLASGKTPKPTAMVSTPGPQVTGTRASGRNA